MIHGVLLGVAAIVSLPPAGTEEAVTKLVVTCSAENRLSRLTVDDRVVATSPALIEEALRALPRSRVAHIEVTNRDTGVPYGCVGGMIFRLQQMGYEQVEVVD